MSEVDLDQRSAIKSARLGGFKIIRGKPDKLLLDLDDNDAMIAFNDTLPFVLEMLESIDIQLVKRRQWKSKSSGQHVVLYLSGELPVLERIALQAILGSDRKKEMYSLLRLRQGTEEPSLLFKPPKTKRFPRKYVAPVDDELDVPF